MINPQLPFIFNAEFNSDVKIKCTMVRTGGGMPVATHIWLKSFKVVKKYGRNDLCIAVFSHEKGKRKIKGYRLDDLTIALGWQNVSDTLNGADGKGKTFTSFEDGALEATSSQLTDILITTLPIKDNRTKLVVVNEEILGCIYPETSNSVTVICSKNEIVKDSESFTIRDRHEIRLASAKDFKNFHWHFGGFDNESEFIFQK